MPPAPWICKYSPPPPLCGLGWMQVPFQGWVGPACGILPPILKVPQLSWASLVPPPPRGLVGSPRTGGKDPWGSPSLLPFCKGLQVVCYLPWRYEGFQDPLVHALLCHGYGAVWGS